MRIAIWPEGSWVDLDEESIDSRMQNGWSDDFVIEEVWDYDDADRAAVEHYRRCSQNFICAL